MNKNWEISKVGFRFQTSGKNYHFRRLGIIARAAERRSETWSFHGRQQTAGKK